MRKSTIKIATGIAFMTLAAACVVSGCGKKADNKADNKANNSTVTQAAENNTTETPAPEGTDNAAAPYECVRLGIKADFGTYAPNIITTEGTDTVQNDTFKAKETILNLSADINGTSYDLATIHVFDRAFDEAELEEMNPMMVYLGQSGNTTYTILYTEECPEQDDEAVKTQWNDIMNNCILKLKDTITLTGLPQ